MIFDSHSPSSGVTTVKETEKGPSPTEVAAAMMHTNVLKGLRPVTVKLFVTEVNWKRSPVSCTVTLMTYWIISPFRLSGGGGSQERTAEVEVTLLASKFTGGATGTVVIEKQIELQLKLHQV